MVQEKSWKEFRETGLFLIINQFLHVFGWAIVLTMEDDGSISKVYPARVKFRGFTEELQTKAYKDISKYMQENSSELLKEAKE